jgi:hypothetical protein
MDHTSLTPGSVTFLIFQRENFQTAVPAEVTISAINFDPDSTPIDSNISFLVVSYLNGTTFVSIITPVFCIMYPSKFVTWIIFRLFFLNCLFFLFKKNLLKILH